MPAKDVYHDCVKNALLKDGWKITHDPYTMTFGAKDVFADLGAEKPLAAEKGDEKILVEIKSFRGSSDMRDLEIAVGQYVLYRSLITRLEPDRKLFLAVPIGTYDGILREPIAQPVIEDTQIEFLVFDPQKEIIIKWTS